MTIIYMNLSFYDSRWVRFFKLQDECILNKLYFFIKMYGNLLVNLSRKLFKTSITIKRKSDASFNSSSLQYVEDLYLAWMKDPNSVHPVSKKHANCMNVLLWIYSAYFWSRLFEIQIASFIRLRLIYFSISALGWNEVLVRFFCRRHISLNPCRMPFQNRKLTWMCGFLKFFFLEKYHSRKSIFF